MTRRGGQSDVTRRGGQSDVTRRGGRVMWLDVGAE